MLESAQPVGYGNRYLLSARSLAIAVLIILAGIPPGTKEVVAPSSDTAAVKYRPNSVSYVLRPGPG